MTAYAKCTCDLCVGREGVVIPLAAAYDGVKEYRISEYRNIVARPEWRSDEPTDRNDSVLGFSLSTECNWVVNGIKKLILRNSTAPF